jgi:hypothetical protein
MSVFHAVLLSAEWAKPERFDTFRKQLDPKWIETALRETGQGSLRRRRLPMDQVVWVVLAMGLFHNYPIEDIVSKLDLALPGAPGTTVARSSIAQARERLGAEPMAWLFEHTSARWCATSGDAHRWRGLEVLGIDGSSLRVPDTEMNRSEFGGHRGPDGLESGYPLVRLVVLMVLRSHLLRAVSVTGYDKSSELAEAHTLLPQIPENSVTIMDRLYLSAAVLLEIEGVGYNRHWLTRCRSTTKLRVLRNLGDGDDLVELSVSSEARRKHPDLPTTFEARAIRYQRPGFAEQTLLTSLRDSKRFPKQELTELYHERWELELGYDELKTELLEQTESIRSQKPEGVRQELWGIFLAYNMVRVEIERVAREAKVPPTRISFVESLRLIRSEWEWLSVTSPGAIPKRLAMMRANIKRYLLPERRSRSFPRAVKRKMSNYPRKRPIFAK